MKEAGFFGDIAKLKADPRTIYSENFVLYCQDYDENKECFGDLLDCVSLICRRSANSANIIVNQNKRISEKVASTVHGSSNEGFVSVLSKCGLIVSKHIRSSSILFCVDNKNEFSVVSFYCKYLSDRYETVPNLREILIKCVSGAIPLEECTSFCGAISRRIKLAKGIVDDISGRLKELDNIYLSEITAAIHSCNAAVVVQPVLIGGEVSGDRYFYVFLPDEQLRNGDIHSIAAFSSSFVEAYRQKKKIQLLTEFQSAEAEVKEDVTKAGINGRYKNKLLGRVNDVFSVLNCHSFTIRMYNPAHNSLQLFAYASTMSADGDDRRQKEEREHIVLSSFRTSVNAFTFLVGSERGEYTYIRNLNVSIPEQYRDLGLESAYQVRPHSRSEICFPFRFGNTVIGTLNLESSAANGFDDDIEFLLSLKSSLEILYRSYFEAFDLDWYRILTKFADPLHELENYLDTDLFSDDQKYILRDLFIKQEEKFKNNNSHSIDSIIPWFKQWVREYYSEETDDLLNEVLGIVEFNLINGFNVQSSTFYAITAIIRNLIKNIEDHSNIRRDKIIIANSARYRSEQVSENYLRIRLKTYGYFEAGVLDSLCFRPILKSTSKGTSRHYGAYILGLLARSVGGFVVLDQHENGYPVIIEFSIPLSG